MLSYCRTTINYDKLINSNIKKKTMQLVARRAHNPEVARSSRVPAT